MNVRPRSPVLRLTLFVGGTALLAMGLTACAGSPSTPTSGSAAVGETAMPGAVVQEMSQNGYKVEVVFTSAVVAGNNPVAVRVHNAMTGEPLRNAVVRVAVNKRAQAETATDDHDIAETMGHGDVGADGHDDADTMGHAEAEADGHDDADTMGHGEVEADGHDDADTMSHGEVEADGHDNPATMGHGDAEADGHGAAETMGHGETGADGHDAAETMGHAVGEADGHDAAETMGHAEGEADGHDAVETMGHAEGEADGHDAAETMGHAEGEAEGHNSGESVGHGHASPAVMALVAGSVPGEYLGQVEVPDVGEWLLTVHVAAGGEEQEAKVAVTAGRDKGRMIVLGGFLSLNIAIIATAAIMKRKTVKG